MVLTKFCSHCGAELKAEMWKRRGFNQFDGTLEWYRYMVCPNSKEGLLFWHTGRVQYGFTRDDKQVPHHAEYDTIGLV